MVSSKCVSVILWTLISVNLLTLVIGGLVTWLGYAIPVRLKQFGLAPELAIGGGLASLLVASLGICGLNYSSHCALNVYGLACALFALLLLTGSSPDIWPAPGAEAQPARPASQQANASWPASAASARPGRAVRALDVLQYALAGLLAIALAAALTLAHHLRRLDAEPPPSCATTTSAATADSAQWLAGDVGQQRARCTCPRLQDAGRSSAEPAPPQRPAPAPLLRAGLYHRWPAAGGPPELGHASLPAPVDLGPHCDRGPQLAALEPRQQPAAAWGRPAKCCVHQRATRVLASPWRIRAAEDEPGDSNTDHDHDSVASAAAAVQPEQEVSQDEEDPDCKSGASSLSGGQFAPADRWLLGARLKDERDPGACNSNSNSNNQTADGRRLGAPADRKRQQVRRWCRHHRPQVSGGRQLGAVSPPLPPTSWRRGPLRADHNSAANYASNTISSCRCGPAARRPTQEPLHGSMGSLFVDWAQQLQLHHHHKQQQQPDQTDQTEFANQIRCANLGSLSQPMLAGSLVAGQQDEQHDANEHLVASLEAGAQMVEIRGASGPLGSTLRAHNAAARPARQRPCGQHNRCHHHQSSFQVDKWSSPSHTNVSAMAPKSNNSDNNGQLDEASRLDAELTDRQPVFGPIITHYALARATNCRPPGDPAAGQLGAQRNKSCSSTVSSPVVASDHQIASACLLADASATLSATQETNVNQISQQSHHLDHNQLDSIVSSLDPADPAPLGAPDFQA